MSDAVDRIYTWTPGTGEVAPLRYRGWWVQYPKPSCSKLMAEPPENQKPIFEVGDIVRLKGKPACKRRVLSVEWHCHRHEFVYIVETSVSKIYGYYPSPYWFAPQLLQDCE